jgi:hypothetical protein
MGQARGGHALLSIRNHFKLLLSVKYKTSPWMALLLIPASSDSDCCSARAPVSTQKNPPFHKRFPSPHTSAFLCAAPIAPQSYFCSGTGAKSRRSSLTDTCTSSSETVAQPTSFFHPHRTTPRPQQSPPFQPSSTAKSSRARPSNPSSFLSASYSDRTHSEPSLTPSEQSAAPSVYRSQAPTRRRRAPSVRQSLSSSCTNPSYKLNHTSSQVRCPHRAKVARPGRRLCPSSRALIAPQPPPWCLRRT